MKRRSITLCVVATLLLGPGHVRGVTASDESLGQKIKRVFAHPTPTPHKRRKASPSPSSGKKARPKASPSASPSPSVAASESPAPEQSPSPGKADAPVVAAASPGPSQTPSEKRRRRQPLSEPVRAISPGPGRRHPKTPAPSVARSPREKGEIPATPTAASQPAKTNGTHASVATIAAPEITGYENYPPAVRGVLDRSLGLTTKNLGYKYGSADPAKGGMDCSGFVHYVLSQSGLADVPRDARELYIWVRKAGTFQAVLAHRDDSFELDALKPGDLLFWSGTYHTDRDPDITHTMIYLGREKGTNQRIMVGSSDGRSYKGQSHFGVSVFDFKVTARKASATAEDPGPAFVGYGRIPGLEQK